MKAIVCKHCNKQINDKAKLVGLSFVCPYCKKPSEKISLEKFETKQEGGENEN